MKSTFQLLSIILFGLFAATKLSAQSISYSDLYTNSSFGRTTVDLTSKPVGTIEGAAGTSPTGAATYTIPIKCPPGTNGMVPNISIVYNSQAGCGLLGQGWNLSGLSAITRSGRDIYHDGEVRQMDYTSQTPFMLDGLRLSPILGVNGASGTTYRTEKETYSVTTSIGTTSGGSPTFFKVVNKDGSFVEYGNTSDSRVMSEDNANVVMWMVSKIQDINGNYVTFEYENDYRDYHIKKVKYTGNTAGLSPYNEIVFKYSDGRVDRNSYYISGDEIRKWVILTEIEIKEIGGDVFKKYQLNYGHDMIASYLKSIEEIASDGSRLSDTRFKYGDKLSSGFEVEESNLTIDLDNDKIATGDYNGDGKDDILKISKGSSGLVNMGIYFNGPSYTLGKSLTGLSNLKDYGTASSFKNFGSVPSDFDGDGRDEILCINYVENLDKYGDAILWDRSYFTDTKIYTPDNLSSIIPTTTISSPPSPNNYTGFKPYLSGDFDGDKRTDYLTIGRRYSCTSCWYWEAEHIFSIYLNFPGKTETNMALVLEGTGSLDEVWAKKIHDYPYTQIIDFDGDGKSEIFGMKDKDYFVANFKKLSSGNYAINIILEGTFSTSENPEVLGIGDFNGDGKSDILCKMVTSGGSYKSLYSTGKNFKIEPFSFYRTFNKEISLPMGGFSSTVEGDQIHIADYNGDGKSDILHLKRNTSSPAYFTNTFFDVYLNNSHDVQYYTYDYSGFVATQIKPVVGDFNGDGKSDLGFAKTTSGITKLFTFYFNKNSTSHLLEKVTDGFNRTTEITYKPLTDKYLPSGTEYFKRGTLNTYPLNSPQFAIYVATSLKSTNGIGGVNIVDFRYENLITHRNGRGLIGFGKTCSIDYTNDIRTESVFDLAKDAISSFDFYIPYLKTSKTFKHSTNFPLSQTENTIKFTKIGSSFCYKEEQTESIVKDLHQGVTTTTNNTFDADGNVTYTISTTTGGETFTSTSTNTFIATGGSSFMNRPSLSITTIKRGSQPTISTEQAFTYNAKGLLVSSVTKPSGGIYTTELTETMGYDAYGNLNHKTIHQHYSSSIPYTHYEYDDYGRFVKSEENTFGDKTYYTTHKFWGKPLAVKGVNGLTTTYTYDAWGKLSTANVPTGPGTSYTINYSDGWDIGTNQLYYTLVQDPSAPDVKTWYDYLGREVKTSKETFGGAWTSSYTSYNVKGNVLSSTNFHLATETPQITTNTYDEYNRIKSSSSVSGTTEYEYVLGGGYISTTVKLPDGTIKKTKADAIGKIIESTNGKAGTVVFDYDSRGNEISHKLKGAFGPITTKITKKYDAIGFLNEMDDMDAGKFGYAYDRRGRIISALSPNSVHTEYDYDIADRLEEKNITKGGVNYKYEYKYFGADKDYRPKEVKVTGPDGIVTEYFDYNVGGGISTYIKDIKGTVFAKSYTYDAYNRPLSSTDNTHLVLPSTGSIFYCAGSGFGTVNQYDANGFLTKISSNTSPAKTLYEATAMNGSGQITAFKRPGAMSSYIDYTNNLPSYFSTGSTQDLTMNYDYRNGNLLSRREGTVTPPVPEESFTYDAVDRLSKSDVAVTISGVSGPVTTHSIIKTVFDSLMSGTMSCGRIISKSDVGTYSYSGFPANAVKEIVIAPGSTVISHETQNIEYNLFDKTQTITEKIGGIEYEEKMLYDASQNRAYTQQSQGSSPAAMAVTRQRWYLGDYEKLTIAGSDQHIHYISSDAGLVAMVVKDAAGYHYYAVFNDHLGSIVKVTDEMGVTVAEQNYDAWGRERNPFSWDYDMTGTFAKPTWLYRGYTGHEMLPEYGLINMNGRIYDPANGRMLRPDNYVQDPLNTQSYNRYSYCLNNPLKYMDPSGDQFEGAGSYGYSNNFVSSGYFNGLPYSFSYNSSYSYYSNSYTSSYNSGYGTTTYMNFVSGYSNSQSISANYAGFNASYSVNFGMNIQSSVVTGYQVNPEIAKLSSIGESISRGVQTNTSYAYNDNTNVIARITPPKPVFTGEPYQGIFMNELIMNSNPITGLGNYLSKALTGKTLYGAEIGSGQPFEMVGPPVASVAARGGGRIFWSGEGAMNTAMNYAKSTGGTTLEMTRAGQNLQNLITTRNIPWSEARPMWERLSTVYANGANGTVHFFPGTTVNPGSIWLDIERNILLRKGVNIITH